MPNTVRLHRVLVTTPEKCSYIRAFIEADALAKWLPPNGFVCTVHQLDAKVTGLTLLRYHDRRAQMEPCRGRFSAWFGDTDDGHGPHHQQRS